MEVTLAQWEKITMTQENASRAVDADLSEFQDIINQADAATLRELAKHTNAMATALEVQQRLQAPAETVFQSFGKLEGTITESEGLIYAVQMLVSNGYAAMAIQDPFEVANRRATLVVLDALEDKLKLAVEQMEAAHQAWAGERRAA